MGAIETIYNGYRFRSRLEARWAVFFDAACIKYQYEPEGFELAGNKYLPDFYLPDYKVFVEVKPDDQSKLDDILRAATVCCKVTGKLLVILSDIPNIENCGIWVFNAFYYHPADMCIMWRPVIFRFFNGSDVSIISDYAITRAIETPLRHFAMSFTDPKPYCPLSGISCYALELGTATDVMARDPTDKIEEARFRFVYYHTESEDDFKTAKYCYDKARQARFEHGEKP